MSVMRPSSINSSSDLLLLFVEILDLVKIQQHAAGSQQRVKLGDDLFYVGKPGGRCVQLAQGAVGFFRR